MSTGNTSFSRDVGLRFKPVIPTVLIPKKIIIPAFSVPAGQTNASLRVVPSATPPKSWDNVNLDNDIALDLRNGLTIDFRLYLLRPNPNYYILQLLHTTTGQELTIYLDDTDVMTITLTTSGGPVVITRYSSDLYYSWHRFTLTWNASESKFKFFLDGELVDQKTTAGLLGNGNHELTF